MRKIRKAVTLYERVRRALRVRAARSGRRDRDVIEKARRRDLDLEVLDRIWARADLDEDEAMRFALEAQHETRPRRS